MIAPDVVEKTKTKSSSRSLFGHKSPPMVPRPDSEDGAPLPSGGPSSSLGSFFKRVTEVRLV